MSTYVLNEERMFADIADGIAIVINSETGIYYGMNGLGTELFDRLLHGASPLTLSTDLAALPEAPKDCEERVRTFVSQLLAFEIIYESNKAENLTAPLAAAVALNDAFAPSVEEFNDAQELLLADPIHEVKADTGWGPGKEALETDETVLAAQHSKIQD